MVNKKDGYLIVIGPYLARKHELIGIEVLSEVRKNVKQKNSVCRVN